MNFNLHQKEGQCYSDLCCFPNFDVTTKVFAVSNYNFLVALHNTLIIIGPVNKILNKTYLC